MGSGKSKNVTIELPMVGQLVVTPARRRALQVVAACDGHARCATHTTDNTIAWRAADWLRNHWLIEEYHRTQEEVGPKGDPSGWYRLTDRGHLAVRALAAPA